MLIISHIAAPAGALIGFDQACLEYLVDSHTSPAVPMGERTNPVRDLTGTVIRPGYA